MSYKSGQEWYINKSLWTNLQNIVRNTSVKFGVCRCYRSWKSSLGVQEKTHFEKTAFKDFYGKIPLISIESHELQTKYALGPSKIHVSHCLTSKIIASSIIASSISDHNIQNNTSTVHHTGGMEKLNTGITVSFSQDLSLLLWQCADTLSNNNLVYFVCFLQCSKYWYFEWFIISFVLLSCFEPVLKGACLVSFTISWLRGLFSGFGLWVLSALKCNVSFWLTFRCYSLFVTHRRTMVTHCAAREPRAACQALICGSHGYKKYGDIMQPVTTDIS